MNVGGSTLDYLASALRGLDAQRQAHEHNVANIETPGFRARRVSFEDSLKRAINDGDSSGVSYTTTLSNLSTRWDGNNVRIDDEMTALEENALKQQLVTRAVNDQFGLTRAALGR